MSRPDPHFVNHVLYYGLEDKFEKLRGAPGICLEPVSWEVTKALVAGSSLDELATLGRHPKDIVTYRKFLRKTLAEYETIAAFVAITILGHACAKNEKGLKVAVTPDRPPMKKPIWRLNDFPYNFEKGVTHYNLWSEVPLTHEEILEEIRKNAWGCESVYFVNPPPLASIPSVWHAHVVSRPKHSSVIAQEVQKPHKTPRLG